MPSVAHSIRFVVRRRPELGGASEVVPVVDGAELTTLIHSYEKQHGMETRDVSYGGLIPSYHNFGPLADHFLGRSESSGQAKVPLLGCECGEWGCWPLLARIMVCDGVVTWGAFEQPFRRARDYRAFGPFRFDEQQYVAALAELRACEAPMSPGESG
jgi:hypothetical protein